MTRYGMKFVVGNDSPVDSSDWKVLKVGSVVCDKDRNIEFELIKDVTSEVGRHAFDAKVTAGLLYAIGQKIRWDGKNVVKESKNMSAGLMKKINLAEGVEYALHQGSETDVDATRHYTQSS